MPLSAFSTGMITDVIISSGLAPGSCSDTFTVAGSALGKRSTPRSRNEKIPSTMSDVTSIVANTGRRTQTSESTSVLRCADGHLLTVRQVVDVGRRHEIAGLEATGDFHAIAAAVAELQLLGRQRVALDHERTIDAVAVLHRRV